MLQSRFYTFKRRGAYRNIFYQKPKTHFRNCRPIFWIDDQRLPSRLSGQLKKCAEIENGHNKQPRLRLDQTVLPLKKINLHS